MKPNLDEYNRIITECRRFAVKEIQPGALEMDLRPDLKWLQALWEKSRSLDLPQLIIPESICGTRGTGGVGYPEKCAALVLDTLAMECVGAASLFAGHFVACAALSEMVKQEIAFSPNISEMMDSECLPVFSVIFSYDPDDSSLVLENINSKKILCGQSSLVLNSMIADYFLVLISNGDGKKDCSCVCVPKDVPGLTINKRARLSGLKVNPFAKITFDNVSIEPEMMMASGETGIKVQAAVETSYFGFTAAMAMGASRSAFIKAVSYANGRYQFGNTIIHHEEIQRMLGCIQMKLNLGTAGYLQTFEDEKVNLPAFSSSSKLAKIYCTDAALEIVQNAIQVHGGYGYMHEYGLEKIMRDVKILQLMGGRNPALHIQSLKG